jgi:hypothetical protein
MLSRLDGRAATDTRPKFSSIDWLTYFSSPIEADFIISVSGDRPSLTICIEGFFLWRIGSMDFKLPGSTSTRADLALTVCVSKKGSVRVRLNSCLCYMFLSEMCLLLSIVSNHFILQGAV